MLGDSNSKYFYRAVQVGRIVNKISFLTNANGNMLEDTNQTGGTCEAYYKGIYAPEGMLELDFKIFNEIDLRYVLENEVAGYLVVSLCRFMMIKLQLMIVILNPSSNMLGTLWVIAL